MKQMTILISLFFLLSSCAQQDIDRVMTSVSEQSVMQHVEALSHDSLRGRKPGTEGEVLTTAYLVGKLSSYGLEPAGENGSFYQDVKILGQSLRPGSFAEIAKGTKRLALRERDDMVMFSGAPKPVVRVQDREIVFVGYGVDAPEQSWDDYKGYDVRGKVLLFLNNDPPSDDPSVFGGTARTYYGRWTYKYDVAAAKGAAGAIVIHNDSSAGYPWSVVANGWSGENLMLASQAEGSSLDFQGWFTNNATREVFTLAGKDFEALAEAATKPDFRPVPLGVALRARMNLALRTIDGKNVIGRLAGSDPELSKEAILFTSHHDHLGVGFPVDGDSIYNGALDNASGMAMSLEMARAFAGLPTRPKRSLLFSFVTAEEEGLLGSQFLATHPTLPLRDIVAVVNIDGFNIHGPTSDINFLGYDRSSLGKDIDAVASVMNMTVSPDPAPEQGSFYRSDHFSFAKVGIPCLSMGGGSKFIGKPDDYAETVRKEYREKHYHQPSDQLSADEPWELGGMFQQFEFVARLTLRIADAAEKPVWNAGDEFEAARLATLRAE